MSNRISWVSLVLAVAMLLSSGMTVSAQDNDVHLPLISNEAEPPLGPLAPQAKPHPAADAALPESDVSIVVMEALPVAAYKGDVVGLAATKPAEGEKLQAGSAAAVQYAQFLHQAQDAVLSAAGVDAGQVVYRYTYALNGFAARLTPEQIREIKEQPGVALVLRDEFRYAVEDEEIDEEAAEDAEFGSIFGGHGAHGRGINGEGVVVGVIDTGIWPEHPSFADNGWYKPLTGYEGLPCEFGNTAHNPDDAPFACNNKLLGARQMLATYRSLVGAEAYEFDSARDDDGHGTHTASTAAGNAHVQASIYGIPRGVISGVAPRARVIAYKGLGVLGGFSSDLAAAIDQAVADGVDVINYSVGGGASLTGADDIAFLFAADAGVFVATSAGNSGPGPATMGGPASVPWITAVGANNQKRNYEGAAVLGNWGVYRGASITPGTPKLPLVDAANAGSELCLLGGLDPTVVTGKIVLCMRGENARAEKSQAVYEAGGLGMILYNTDDVSDLATDTHWVPSVYVDLTPGLAIKDYIATDPNPTARILRGRAGTWRAPIMAVFSSRGPNPVAEDIIKPDITAPGMQILAGYSPYNDPVDSLFAAIQGTSMSSPYIAGIFALVKQVRPDWTPAMAKSAIMTTAYQKVLDNDRVSPADPFAMGAGHVNPAGKVYNGWFAAAELDDEFTAEHRWPWTWPIGIGNKGSLFEPGLVYDAGINEYFGFLCGAAPEIFVDPEGTCSALATVGVPTDPSDLNLASIGVSQLAGSQTVKRTVTSVVNPYFQHKSQEYTVHVDAPEGYTVTVNPSTLKLKAGETATYEVTITNVDAPIGEWRFGSLTWKDQRRQYSVRSPIAVKAALFDAPAEISGAGESGSASFDVSFGYTGAYTAAAHGLEPAVVAADNVVQDPDQTFDPADGFSKLHTFNLSGAAYFRVAIPPEAAETDADLDVYVYNPDGDLVASSTSGGTDEQIDITLPADGTWSVYVHGWTAPGGDSDYTLYAWVISATPGGNLVIDSAPAAATIGVAETIAVSWTGATAGEWHLGAVSHTGDSGLMGLTLVEVDNR